MKALPDLTNGPAMIKRGQMSAIGSARAEAQAALRDASTHCQSCDWAGLAQFADDAIAAAERLKTVAALWQEFGD
jgi:hypothetical protein